jgi:outer membrane biosynthesis protein TonB
VNLVNTSTFQQEQQAIEAKIRQARDHIAGLEDQVRGVERELEGLFEHRQKYQLLTQVCESLDKLDSLGAGQLFWGEQSATPEVKDRVDRARAQAAQFNEKIAGIEQNRDALNARIEDEFANIGDWEYDLAVSIEQEERKKSEFLVEREISELPYRPLAMPWDPDGEDAKRLRKSVFIALLLSIALGGGTAFWKLPPREKYVAIEVPERLVKMVKAEPPPKPPKKEVKEKDEKKPDEKKPDEKKPQEKVQPKPVETTVKTATATTAEVKEARAKAESSGMLAFKNNFSEMLDDDMPSELGSDAKITNAGRQNPGGAAGTRSLIVAQGTGSGGIANFAVSRGGSGNGSGSGRSGGGDGVGNGSGRAITGGGHGVGKATSGIANGMGDADRPLSKGAGPARTDEEIQIVFDKYKAALYRIYNRELRNDPSLRGKMVLALTIEPDGRVSACRVQSTDMNSDALSKDIVERVFKFNFGEKEGVPTTKILYPIDFLPAG